MDGGKTRTAYYGGLAPGTYRFEVITANADDVWNKTGTSVEFELRPHFDQTLWFYLGWALLTLGLIWSYSHWAEAKLRREKAALERGVAERTSELNRANARLKAQIRETEAKAAALHESEDRLRRLSESLELRVQSRTAELQDANR